MTAELTSSGSRAQLVAKAAAAVREALDPDWRAEFEAAYWPALREDEERPDSRAVAEVVGAWWPRAVLCRQLSAADALLAGVAASGRAPRRKLGLGRRDHGAVRRF